MKIFKVPFAATGDKITIPTVEQPSGEISQPTGWTPDYQLPNTDPNYKPVGRDEMNGVLFEITEALGQLQQFGFADWQSITGGWPVGANVNHEGGVWQSLANSNTEEPGTGALWKPILFDNIVQATESVLGLVQIATTAQSQALTADDAVLTPKKLGDAMNAHVLGMGQTWQNVTSSRVSGTTYTNTTGRSIQLSILVNWDESLATAYLNVNGALFASAGTSPASSQTNFNPVLPAGATYQLVTAGNLNIAWWELR